MKVVSFSGGKDSTAMLLRLLELGEQIDRIIFADTGFEFPELYEYIKRIEKHIGRKIEIIKPETTFDDWRLSNWTKGELMDEKRGFPRVLVPCYWTREAKIKPLQKAHKDASVVYVGIAYDERQRCVKKAGKIRYPLVEWKWTEQDCVNYLNEKGLLNPLYVNFKRLGCWLCPKQNKSSLYVLWKNYPSLWSELEEYEKENIEICGRNIFLEPLADIKEDFEQNGEPKGFKGYECSEGCDGVKRAFLETQTGLVRFGNCGVSYYKED